jgi:hypothetical protein
MLPCIPISLLICQFLVTPDSNFDLKAVQSPSIYTTDVDGNPKGPDGKPIKGTRMTTNVTAPEDVPPASPARQERAVKSVFPMELEFMFDEFGDKFTGAYKGVNHKVVYACKGETNWKATGVAFPGHQTNKTKPTVLPLQDSVITDRRSVPGRKTATDALTPAGLLSMDPFYVDNSGRERDKISDAVMDDMQQITLYYMDTDLRELFISKTPIVLDPEIRSIAENNPENKQFYKSLQVPFLVSMLSSPAGSKSSRFFVVCNAYCQKRVGTKHRPLEWSTCG